MEKATSITGILILAALSFAQAAPPHTPPAENATELEQLRAENLKLRQQVQDLQAQLSTQLAASQPARNVPAVAAQLGTATPTTKPAARPFTSMPEILARLPQELRPQSRRDWYEFYGDKFIAWWKNQLVGLSFEQSLALKAWSVQRASNPKPGAEWEISFISVEGKSFTALGAENYWSLDYFRLYANDATAKYWMNMKKGTLVKIRGIIKGADIDSFTTSRSAPLPTYHVYIHLSDPQVIAPGP